MTFHLPRPGDPRRPFGPRNPGDAWAISPTGERYWGRFGAAGLLAVDPTRGILLQHRAQWSHYGGTWGLPGGARHEGESAGSAALREAGEEAGVPDGAVQPRLISVLDLGFWSYATVVGDVRVPFEPTVTDAESLELAWVPVDQVADRPLHPGFAAAWPGLAALLPVRPAIVVDAANVIGSVPDGWWRDRPGAARRLLARIAPAASAGLSSDRLGLAADRWFPEWVVVLEGQARSAGDAPDVDVARAAGSGDDEIVAQAQRLVGAGRSVLVVTGDRALRDRVREVGAHARGAGWLLDLLAASPAHS